MIVNKGALVYPPPPLPIKVIYHIHFINLSITPNHCMITKRERKHEKRVWKHKIALCTSLLISNSDFCWWTILWSGVPVIMFKHMTLVLMVSPLHLIVCLMLHSPTMALLDLLKQGNNLQSQKSCSILSKQLEIQNCCLNLSFLFIFFLMLKFILYNKTHENKNDFSWERTAYKQKILENFFFCVQCVTRPHRNFFHHLNLIWCRKWQIMPGICETSP